MMNGIDNVQKVGRENMDRALQSFSALSRSWQHIATETADLAKQSFEQSASQFERVLAAKSFQDAFEAQADFVKTSYDKALDNTARVGELYLGLVKDVAKPFETAGTTASR